MKNLIKLGGGIALCLAFAGASSAADFQDSMAKCLTKHANTRDAAVVMLECSATAGQLSGCKVLDDSKAGKGSDKPALCVAAALRMGSKTGVVKVPMRFPGGA